MLVKHNANTTKYNPNAHQVSVPLIEIHRLTLAAVMIWDTSQSLQAASIAALNVTMNPAMHTATPRAYHFKADFF